MRTQHFRTGPAWRTNLAEAPALPAIESAPELPRTQIMALLTVRAGGPDSLFGKVLTYMRAVGSDAPTQADQIALAHAGYIQFRRIHALYVLTPAGLHKAETLARELARQYEIHHIILRPALKRSTSGPTASCSCGCWSAIGPKSAPNRVAADAERHLASVAAGTWVKPRPVEEFLNEIAPPQFDFSPGLAKPSTLPSDAAEPGHGAAMPDVRIAAPVDLEAWR